MKRLDKRQVLLALLALVVVFSAALGFSLAGVEPDSPDATRAELAALEDNSDQEACASAATYAQLKQVLFNDALKVRSSDPDNLNTLATHSVVRMEDPVVKSRDASLGTTVCAGTFILELPPGAEQAFGGERRLVADINYTVRPAADGSGLVYQMNGAEPIMAQLADFNLNGSGYILPQQPETQFAEAASLPDAMLGIGGPEEPTPTDDEERAAEVARAEAEAEDREARDESEARVAEAAREERAREQRAERAREQRRAERAERARRAEARAARSNSRPSFNCRHARTRSELMVCDSQRLAARDREMSALFYAAMEEADRRKRRELNRTRDRFLAYRDRCRSEDCVAEAYVGRMREIEDIMASR